MYKDDSTESNNFHAQFSNRPFLSPLIYSLPLLNFLFLPVCHLYHYNANLKDEGN